MNCLRGKILNTSSRCDFICLSHFLVKQQFVKYKVNTLRLDADERFASALPLRRAAPCRCNLLLLFGTAYICMKQLTRDATLNGNYRQWVCLQPYRRSCCLATNEMLTLDSILLYINLYNSIFLQKRFVAIILLFALNSSKDFGVIWK